MSFYQPGLSPLLYEMREGKFKFSPFMQFAIFFLVFCAADLVNSVIVSCYITLTVLSSNPAAILISGTDIINIMMSEAVELQQTDGYILVSLLASSVYGIAALVYCRAIEKRPFSTMGLRTENALPSIPLGILIGAVSVVAAILLSTLNGSVTLTAEDNPQVGSVILFFFAFLLQATGEELLFRGYLLMSLSRFYKTVPAVILSSLMFAILHIGNNGFNVVAFINLVLFGLLLSLLMLRTGSLIGPCLLHALWNFTEGCILGSPVSGNVLLPSIWRATPDAAKVLTNGGAFGPEGGIAVTIVLLITLFILWFIPTNKKVDRPMPMPELIIKMPGDDSTEQK